MIEKCKRVQSNLLKQNCFLHDVCLPTDVRTVYKQEEYAVLESKTVDNGVKEEISFRPYPITSEYVSSFASSCDVSRDIGCLSSNMKEGRTNLGDIRETQKFSKMDLSQIRALIEHLQSVADKAVADKVAADKAAVDKAAADKVAADKVAGNSAFTDNNGGSNNE